MSQSGIHLVDSPLAARCLVDPASAAVLRGLQEPASAATVARSLGITRQRGAYFVKKLERAGLIAAVGERRVGNCTERLMQSKARHYLLASSLLDQLGPLSAVELQDRFSSAYAAGAALAVAETVTRMGAEAESAGLRLATSTLQSRVRVASPATFARFNKRLSEMLAELIAEFQTDAGGDARSFDVSLFLHPTEPNAPEGEAS